MKLLLFICYFLIIYIHPERKEEERNGTKGERNRKNVVSYRGSRKLTNKGGLQSQENASILMSLSEFGDE
jgi:hypothetical protein